MQFPLFRDDYRLRERLSPKARNIRIEVRPGAEVVLIYPRFVARSEALNFLRSREDWIRQKLHELAQRTEKNPPPASARWDGSDQLSLRGSRMTVQVVPATVKRIAVRIEAPAITLFCPPALMADHARLELALKRELQHQARADAQKYLQVEAARLQVKVAGLRINDPQTLWGSCNPTGMICLSWRLVMAPPEIFHYVVVHEVCHLLQRNHSARFWALVEQRCPGYEPHKRWLREHGASLHHSLPARRGK